MDSDLLSKIKCRSIKILNHNSKDGKVIYIIEITLSNNQSVIINERYSELLNLHNSMSKEAKLPTFPPKKLFGNMGEFFINQRQTDLNAYYNIITSSDKYISLPSFKAWIKKKLHNIDIKVKEEFNYYVMEDLTSEKLKQKKVEKELNKIIPQFIDMTTVWDQEVSNKKRENRYINIINTDLFPFVDNEPYNTKLEGNNTNFNFIGSKKNNLIKVEKLFNTKLNDINKMVNSECVEKYKIPDLLMDLDDI